MNSKNFKRIVFYSSETCNLNCKYCVLSKSSNKDFHLKEQEKIKEAFLNGSYVSNFKKAFREYGINRGQIYRVELWGEEPTLTLNEFAQAFPEILNAFPNIRELFFSTNGAGDLNRIITLINTINESIEKDFNLLIQFSYDGKIMETSRGIDEKIVRNNIKQLIIKLNEITLDKKLKIEFNFHSVLSRMVVNKYKTIEEVEEYWKFFDDFILEMQSLNKNKNILIAKRVSSAMENPVDATVEEGKNLALFLKNTMAIKDKVLSNPFMQFNNVKNSLEHINKDINELLTLIGKEENIKGLNYRLSKKMGCGTMTDALKLRYNGDLVYCQNILYKLNFEDLNEELDSSDYHKFLIKNHYHKNIKDEDSIEIFEKYKELKDSSFYQLYSENLNLMHYLANANLIDSIYKYDSYKVLKHALILTLFCHCIDNNLNETGSIVGRSVDSLKYYCNGAMNYIESLVFGNSLDAMEVYDK